MRDIRERLADPEESLREAQDSHQARIWTALPGYVVSFDPNAVTCSIQPTISATQTGSDGSKKQVNLPVLLDCPVVFPSGGGATLTFPLQAGDEVLAVIASRCIDGWWQQGGIQTAPMFRMHDLSDGFAIPGPKSQARLIGPISLTATELRADDGETVISLDPTAQTLVLTAPGGVTINGDVQLNGQLQATGIIKSLMDVFAAAISLLHHKHGNVQSGGSQTGESI